MTSIVYFAWLNVIRNIRRTVLSLISIIAGFVALSCFGGFIQFSFVGLQETIIRTQIGHFQIREEGWRAGHLQEPEKFLIREPKEIVEAVSRIEGVEVVAERFQLAGLATIGQRAVNVSVIGIDPIKNRSFADFELLIDGRQIRPGDRDVGVIGELLMKGLGAEIGDWVTLLATTVDGTFNAIDFQIVGTVSTSSQEYDRVFVKLPIELTQRVRDTSAASEITVLLDDTRTLSAIEPKIRSAIEATGRTYEMSVWNENAPYYDRVVNLYTGLFNVFAIIVGIVVLLSVANVITLAVLERSSEIGALRAIGASKLRILMNFILEGFFIGIVGCILGLIISLAVSYFTDVLGGISMPAPPGMSRGYQAKFLMNNEVLFLSSLVTLSAAVISSIYPAISAARKNIILSINDS